ncbi:zinc knuckle [Botrytis cinerea]
MSWEAPAGGNGWGTGETAVVSGGANEFNDGAANDYGGYGGGEENGGGGGGRSGGCFNCGEEGHSKAECTQPPKARSCYNCGEEGHTKAECTNPAVAREFTGTCRICEQSGHRASGCPSAPPKLCNNCKEEGHSILECKNPRKIERNDVEDVAAEVAWENLIKQSQEGDFDDMKYEVMKYIKASPDATYVQLENAFRTQNIPIYLIAMEKELTQTYTNMDLQGNLDRKYSVSWRKSSKHSRPKEKESWPGTPEENLERLADAGEPVDRGVPLCSRCNELGHTVKHCTEERVDGERVQVQCFNCGEIGHRVRDCPIPREDKFACRNCKKSGHSSKECPEPRSAEGVECKNCNEIGHFSRDCPTGGGGDGGLCRNCNQPGHRAKDCTNERVMICRNCDEEGHTGKECPKPRDYSRVQCQNCKQMGHTKVRCKEPIAEEDAAGDANGDDGGDYGGGDAANDVYSAPATGGNDDNWATGGGQEVVGDGGW